KQDARNLAKALWVHVVTGEFGIPTVYTPAVVVRDLRNLFAQYCLLNRQIATHKNNAQSIFVENGRNTFQARRLPILFRAAWIPYSTRSCLDHRIRLHLIIGGYS
ncbi:MAG: hypothetical protein NT005_05715, partial [Spirochaetes bacterium]|nr:hypothetical protein [Spirochaetota bacterium]